ncbi:hypothetical protein FRB90_001823 [Tulasnella sp. 427]|nr:hypothetical protein FRB90_001823 [Tulasnella sp. 427]
MSATAQARQQQPSYFTTPNPGSSPLATPNPSNHHGHQPTANKFSSSSNIPAPEQMQPQPRISSAYRRTLETHGGSQSGTIDLDTFDVPCPPSAPFPSPRTTRFSSDASAIGLGMAPTASATGEDRERPRKKSSPVGALGNLPDLGVVDLSDGKNKERPQRFKAVIHFKKRDPNAGRRSAGAVNEENDDDGEL